MARKPQSVIPDKVGKSKFYHVDCSFRIRLNQLVRARNYPNDSLFLEAKSRVVMVLNYGKKVEFSYHQTKQMLHHIIYSYYANLYPDYDIDVYAINIKSYARSFADEYIDPWEHLEPLFP